MASGCETVAMKRRGFFGRFGGLLALPLAPVNREAVVVVPIESAMAQQVHIRRVQVVTDLRNVDPDRVFAAFMKGAAEARSEGLV